MAPYNLSDYAVKETRIAGKDLYPAAKVSLMKPFLKAHFLDFMYIYLINDLAMRALSASLKSHLTTLALKKAWKMSSLSAFSLTSFVVMAVTYFFCSFYLNHGQTPGMMLAKCRVRLKEHSFAGSLNWTFKSLLIGMTCGWIAPRFKEDVLAHDHLWHELVAQKEMAAPDVRTLVADEVKRDYAEAA